MNPSIIIMHPIPPLPVQIDYICWVSFVPLRYPSRSYSGLVPFFVRS